MASEPEPSVQLNNVFNIIIFGSIIVVGVLVVLASLLKILDLWWWLSNRLQEYRARPSIDDVRAPNVGDGMVENDGFENSVVDDGMNE